MYFQPRFVQGEEADIQAAVTGENHEPEVRPDGIPTLRRYAHAVWRRRWIVLVTMALVTLVTLAATLLQADKYEASADVLVNRQEVATTTLVGQTPALDDANRTMQTQARLAQVPLVVERTLEAAGVPSDSVGAYLGRSSVLPLFDILRFNVSDEDPERAVRLATEHARQFVRYRQQLDTAGLAQTLAELRGRIRQFERSGETDSPVYERLVDNEQQLEVLKALRTSNVSVVRAARPGDAEQVAPRPRRNVALALAVGLVLGLVLAFLWESLSTRPRSDAEIEALLGMPMLARLRLRPRTGRLRQTDDRLGSGADAMHALRTGLALANAQVGARAIMVTSASAGEGKSAIAAELAVSFARAGQPVVLVDLDFRESSVSRLFGLEGSPGVASVVRGERELVQALDALSPGDVPALGVGVRSNGRAGAGPLLQVLASGALTGHPAELLSSEALGDILSELGARAGVVLVDLPPILEAPDAASVASRLDGLLLVVSSRRARGPSLSEVRRAVDRWPLVPLGFALVDGVARATVGDVRHVPSPVAQRAEPEQVA